MRRCSATVGMQTFDEALYRLYSEGRITLEEALRNADSANNLRLRIKLADDASADDPKGTGAFRAQNHQTTSPSSSTSTSSGGQSQAAAVNDELKLSLD